MDFDVISKSIDEVIKELGAWNSITFYKRNGKIITYADWVDINIVDYKEYEGLINNMTSYSVEYDFNKSFFENFEILFRKVPWPNLFKYGNCENAEYADIVINSKNVYLSKAVVFDCENILYSYFIKENCRNIYNSIYVVGNNDNIYWSFGVFNSYNVFYSRYIVNSSDIWFSTNLIGCKECIFCDGLENKSYCINNVQYSKEEYEKKKQEILSQKEKFEEWYSALNNNGFNLSSHNVNGSFVVKSENVENGYFCYNVRNGKNVIFVGGTEGDENVFNLMFAGSPFIRDSYNTTMSGRGEKIDFCWYVDGGYDVMYSMNCIDSSDLFGCIGLVNKRFCILNKEYTKEEYFEMKKKILNQMEKTGEIGKFFPSRLSLFNFNDTRGYLLGRFNKEEIVREGYKWRDEGIKVDIPVNIKLVNIKDADIVNFDENVLKVVYSDDKGNYWRIMPLEYKFLKKYGLPLSRIHWLDRLLSHVTGIIKK